MNDPSSNFTLGTNQAGVTSLDAASTNNVVAMLASTAAMVEFSDQTVVLATSGSVAQTVAELYIGILHRAPDSAGLSYWEGQLNGGASLSGVIDGFIGSQEYATDYGSATTPTAFVTALYANTLNRAPDSAGLAYWVGQLSSGAETKEQVIEGFLGSAEFVKDTTFVAGVAPNSTSHTSVFYG